MWIFRRSPERDRRDVSRDAEYGFFSVDEGAHFRAQVREAFAEQGLEVTLHAGAVSDSAGRRFGLGNIAAICHNDPRGRRWYAGGQSCARAIDSFSRSRGRGRRRDRERAARTRHPAVAQRLVSRSRLLRSTDCRTARAADCLHLSGVDSRIGVFGRAREPACLGSQPRPRDSDLHARQLRRCHARAQGIAGLRGLGRCQLPHARRHGQGPVESDHQY